MKKQHRENNILIIVMLYILIHTSAWINAQEQEFETGRMRSISGTVIDGSEQVNIFVQPLNTLPGTARSYTAATTGPVNAARYEQKTPSFPGINTVQIMSDKSKSATFFTFKVEPAPQIRFELSWDGGDLDYDLYVNSIFYGNKSAGGGILDRDAIHPTSRLDATENVTFPGAAAGLYHVYVNFYDNHYHGTWLPTDLRIYINEEEIAYFTGTITNPRAHGASLAGNGISVWNVCTLVVHSGMESGGYIVTDSGGNMCLQGQRNLADQCRVLNYSALYAEDGDLPVISPQTNYRVDTLTGPAGSNDVSINTGESIQFTATGTVNVGSSIEERKAYIIENFKFSDGSTANTIALIDELGVLTALSQGTVMVTCNNYTGPDIRVNIRPVSPGVLDLENADNREEELDHRIPGTGDPGSIFKIRLCRADDINSAPVIPQGYKLHFLAPVDPEPDLNKNKGNCIYHLEAGDVSVASFRYDGDNFSVIYENKDSGYPEYDNRGYVYYRFYSSPWPVGDFTISVDSTSENICTGDNLKLRMGLETRDGIIYEMNSLDNDFFIVAD